MWGGRGAGLTEIKANSASQESWSWGKAELGNIIQLVISGERWIYKYHFFGNKNYDLFKELLLGFHFSIFEELDEWIMEK